ncbi:dual oxidase 2-like [Penaeus chinensis]|uniref:dual oxidase 2-like n=1 Tax=Penaeus chinensis TaxID=139456 RepID=UPI001FB5E5A8|nr:dual oxidase 2-like [Penaeus chinensis]
MWLKVLLVELVFWTDVALGQCPSHVGASSRPPPCTWAGSKQLFLDWLIGGCVVGASCGAPADRHVEYEGYDGWYNNLAKPSQGAVDTPLLRLLPPAYEDGVYQPVRRKANPLEVSEKLMRGQNGKMSKGGRTAFLLFFGQQVVEELLDAQGPGCPPEYFNIDIKSDHDFARSPKLKVMPLLRTRYDMTTGFSPNNPRQQLNEITPYLDGGLVYGTSKGWADALRTFANGSLAQDGLLAWHDQLGEGFPAENAQRLPLANPPPPTNHSSYVRQQETAKVDRFFKLGNPRGNENPFLLTFGIVWFRWHNHVARYLRRVHRGWSGERVFNEARKWVIATYQAVVFYDWLPKYMHTALPKYQGYRPTVDPQVSHIFQSAAMRFGHTLVTSGVYLRDKNGQGCTPLPFELTAPEGSSQRRVVGVRTCNSFWRSPELFTRDPANFERFLMGLSSQSTEEEDNVIVDDLRGRVFGPLEFSRRDLMAINIQRGRDHGLPDYNTARRHFGLATLTSLDVEEYKQKTGTHVEDQVLASLRSLYDDDPSSVDIWPGGLLETRNGPGQLFSKVILDQFERIRDADRFWFENSKSDLFTQEERDRLGQVRILDVILSITNLEPSVDIQEDPFTAVHQANGVGNNCMVQLSVPRSCTLHNNVTATCNYLPQISDSNAEECTKPETYDYFSGSEVSYILVLFFLLGLCFATVVVVKVMAVMKVKRHTKKAFSSFKIQEGSHKAKERVALRESRYVVVRLEQESRRIEVTGTGQERLRIIDLSNVQEMKVRHLQDFTQMIICVSNHYDLFLSFEDGWHAKRLHKELTEFCENLGINLTLTPESKTSLQFGIVTVKQREKQLADFSRVVLSNAFGSSKQADVAANLIAMGSHNKNYFLSMELTQVELANQLGMLPDSVFVKQLFRLMDQDGNGFITLKEFWDVMVVFARGKPEEKARLIFNIYDISRTGQLSAPDLVGMVRSTLGSESKNQDISHIVQTMLHSVGVSADQPINFEQFQKIFNTRSDVFNHVQIDVLEMSRKSNSRFSLYDEIPTGGFAAEAARKEYDEARQEMLTQEESDEVPKDKLWLGVELSESFRSIVNNIKNKQQTLFWGTLYTIVMLLIFAERAYYYTIEREHAGLRRIAGLGVTVTRGAASAMMFTYSTLLVTMCRNVLSFLRSTMLHRIFPFDNMVDFHRYIGAWALFWTLVHIIGHCINFYHISTQTAMDLACIFRDFFRGTHVLPKFHYWCLQTITGLTGVLLTIHTAVIYAFAYFARRHFFWLFWLTHNTYPVFYVLMVFHGSGRLVQPPFFHFFFLGPCLLFVLDKLVSFSRNKIQIDVKSVTHLPSNVTLLEIRRPPNFSFQSGQWVRIASLGISSKEYHPFTLSSAPHEENLTLHIRAVGPWTHKLRKIYKDKATMQKGEKHPQIYMDGPFGEGHQNWWDFEVVIFVAGGIGVTPFASILKDIAYKLEHSKYLKTKKVIFLWTTRSQKQFEWMTDILRTVEAADRRNIIRTHVFITQFKSKFDLRTIMLYLAERHFQKISGTSLFTGLRAITHFSRPDFTAVFASIKKKYGSMSSVVGVFTCGSPNLSRAVEQSCQVINQEEGALFRHYYENF